MHMIYDLFFLLKLVFVQVNFKLRDWLFARQRYWGEPIPVVFLDDTGETVPILETELPLTLPELDDFSPTGTGEPPLSKAVSWVQFPSFLLSMSCYCLVCLWMCSCGSRFVVLIVFGEMQNIFLPVFQMILLPSILIYVYFVTFQVKTKDPLSGKPARRETSTMPQWAGSCW